VRPATIVPVALAGVAGVAAGYVIGYNLSVGGLGATFTSGLTAFGVAGLVVVLVLVGIAALLTKRSGLSAQAFRVATSLTAATIVTVLAVPALGLGYTAPVSRQAAGTGAAVLDAAGFAPTDDGEVTCQSMDDSTDVATITFYSFGELNGGTVRSMVYLAGPEPGTGQIELIIDGADLPEGSGQPTWSGDAHLSLDEGGRSGSASFSGLPLRLDPPDAAPTEGWPATLTGDIHWRCDPWLEPGAPGATAARRVMAAT
jgi:hypothetical protein